VIRELKKRIVYEEREGGSKNADDYLSILDVPPGTSCPVVEAMKGSDFAVLVTEPTPFGLCDLKLAVATVKKMKIPCGIVVNRDGVEEDGVQDYCKREGIPILMRIPMDKKIAVAYSRGIPFVEIDTSYKDRFRELYRRIVDLS
jgi:MinD superfamily P-loop ATPase